MCEYCEIERRDKIGYPDIRNKPLIWLMKKKTKELISYAEIHPHEDEYYLEANTVRIKINNCPMCGRKLKKMEDS